MIVLINILKVHISKFEPSAQNFQESIFCFFMLLIRYHCLLLKNCKCWERKGGGSLLPKRQNLTYSGGEKKDKIGFA